MSNRYQSEGICYLGTEQHNDTTRMWWLYLLLLFVSILYFFYSFRHSTLRFSLSVKLRFYDLVEQSNDRTVSHEQLHARYGWGTCTRSTFWKLLHGRITCTTDWAEYTDRSASITRWLTCTRISYELTCELTWFWWSDIRSTWSTSGSEHVRWHGIAVVATRASSRARNNLKYLEYLCWLNLRVISLM